jgi:uncharacterized coiled-coil protein SlyX
MTQTQPDRLDQLESVIERIDHKLDAIADDVAELKTEARVFQAKTEEQLKGIDGRLTALETRVTAQDSRLWTFITGLVLVLVGFLAKLAFFPQA